MLPNATMPITMSKFLALGMPLQEVVYRSTHKPAKVLRRPELGHLSVGSEADLAAFALHEGDFCFVDSGRAKIQARKKLRMRTDPQSRPNQLGSQRAQPRRLGTRGRRSHFGLIRGLCPIYSRRFGPNSNFIFLFSTDLKVKHLDAPYPFLQEVVIHPLLQP